MPSSPRTWIVLARDVSNQMQVAGEPTTWVAMVLDAGTGLVLGSTVDRDVPAALRGALGQALRRPVPPAPRRPELVVAAPDLVEEVAQVLTAKLGPQAPKVEEGVSPAAQDILDGMIGALTGRVQPANPPTPEDWTAAYEALLAFSRQQPWRRWGRSSDPLSLEIRRAGESVRYSALVWGSDGSQAGLVLEPEGQTGSPKARRRAERTGDPSVGGVLLLLLADPGEMPADLVARARRYGWPAEESLAAMPLVQTMAGLGDPSRDDLQALTVAVAGLAAHDRRGLVPAGPGGATRGVVTLAGGEQAEFAIVLPEPAAASPASIAELLDAFLTDQQQRLAPSTFRKYADVVELLGHSLNGYGHLQLSGDDLARYEQAYKGDEDAFVHLFGAEELVGHLSEFLGYFMVRKVMGSEALLRSAGTVTKKLVAWLEAGGHLSAEDAAVAKAAASEGAADLPNAGRLASVLARHANRTGGAGRGRGDGEVIEDYLTIERVEGRALWFAGGIGPVPVPAEAAKLAQEGWSVSCGVARTAKGWSLEWVGNVYP